MFLQNKKKIKNNLFKQAFYLFISLKKPIFFKNNFSNILIFIKY